MYKFVIIQYYFTTVKVSFCGRNSNRFFGLWPTLRSKMISWKIVDWNLFCYQSVTSCDRRLWLIDSRWKNLPAEIVSEKSFRIISNRISDQIGHKKSLWQNSVGTIFWPNLWPPLWSQKDSEFGLGVLCDEKFPTEISQKFKFLTDFGWNFNYESVY